MMRVAELCAGYGGISRGLDLAGIGHEVSWFAETDEYAATVFAHHHPDAPNLGDLTQITDPPEVDIVTAGFPCQPVSLAGSRKGTKDERWLIEDVCRVARLSRARWLILENVSGLLTANDGDAMAHVCQAMAHNGYRRWAWTTVRASDVGAPHQRNRWFCIATTADTSSVGREPWPRPGTSEPARLRRNGFGNDGGTAVADTDGGPVRNQPIGITGGGDTTQPRPNQPTPWGQYQPAINRWEHITGRPAPDPTVDGRLNPRAVEFMMGLPDGHVTGHVNRTQALRILGNGCVPLQAAAAVRMLT